METDSRIAKLPIMVRSEFAKMDVLSQAEFLGEYQRRRKGLALAYFASFLSLHYAYVGRFGLTLLCWLVGLLTMGIALVIWWIIDLFRMPSIIANKNADIAIDVLRDQKIIRG